MTSFEAIYGRPCRSLIYWIEVEDPMLLDLELVRETIEVVALTRRRLLTAQSYQVSYVTKVNDHWNLMLGIECFGDHPSSGVTRLC